ncbi:MAG: DUF2442 domain-containing protein [Sulfuritalea sp.]|nr:DUF2442 domain-containing protein [Sulfuritalea sp.]MDP1984843.1 DUF2442 domain-containing protein [Sulfuritalea sp.]
MRIANVIARPDFTLQVSTTDGREGVFDVRPYLDYEAFRPLQHPPNFMNIRNGGYFIEWDCGADLSADTIEARMSQTTDA